MAISAAMLTNIAVAYAYVAAWIGASAGVILYNKWILTVWGFDFPITLTIWHMAFCSALSFALVRSGTVSGANINRQTYVNSVVPIGALFSGTLWFGNAAYTYLSVSFIQMLKALMPAAVFTCGLFWGVEKKDYKTMCIMAIVTTGVMIASYGELLFVVAGVVYQLLAICTESNRIVLVQILLQSKGLKLNPITSMYYISPCCLLFLFVPWVVLEVPQLLENAKGRNWLDSEGAWRVDHPWMICGIFIFMTNAIAAFSLNCTVFLLIGKTSALTMNIAGVVKDWILIYLSWLLFHGPITALSLGGYGIAFAAVCVYNYTKLVAMKEEEARKDSAGKEAKVALLDGQEETEMKAIAVSMKPAAAQEKA